MLQYLPWIYWNWTFKFKRTCASLNLRYSCLKFKWFGWKYGWRRFKRWGRKNSIKKLWLKLWLGWTKCPRYWKLTFNLKCCRLEPLDCRRKFSKFDSKSQSTIMQKCPHNLNSPRQKRTAARSYQLYKLSGWLKSAITSTRPYQLRKLSSWLKSAITSARPYRLRKLSSWLKSAITPARPYQLRKLSSWLKSAITSARPYQLRKLFSWSKSAITSARPY
jgi:hypothetical protein